MTHTMRGYVRHIPPISTPQHTLPAKPTHPHRRVVMDFQSPAVQGLWGVGWGWCVGGMGVGSVSICFVCVK
jgi:hypothetical protein